MLNLNQNKAMATIQNKFHFYNTIAKFNAKKASIPSTSIAFVDQPYVAADPEQGTEEILAQQFIYTQGKTFTTSFDATSIEAAITALDGRLDTLEAGDTVSGSVAYAVKTLSDTIMGLLGNGFDTTNTVAKGISDVNDRIDNLDLTEVTESGKAIIAVSQANGQVSAAAGDVAAAHVTVADSGDVFTGTTVEAVLAEIDAAWKAAIAGLDSPDTPVAKKVVTGVSEADGVITVTRKELKSTDKTVTIAQAATSDDIDFSVNIDGTTILKDAETGVLSVASSALVQYVGDDTTISVSAESEGEKTISSLIKIAEVTTGLDSNIEQAWDLVDANGDAISGSSRIIVKKDQAFVNGKMGHVDDTINASTGVITDGTGAAAIDLIYKNAQGQYVLITINVEEYLKESEFKDGLAVNNHEVSVKLSSNTESAKYLKIQAISGENGAIELSGIDAAIAAASSSIAAKTTGHVTVSSTSDANGTVYTISESDIASAQDLSDEVTRAENAETAIDAVVGLTKDGSSETRTYSNTGTYIGQLASNTVASDIAALDTQVAANATAAAGAKTSITEKATGHVTVTKTAGSGATPDNYVIDEDDIASASLVGTIPSGATATTVTGYAAEVASDEADAAEAAAKSYADDITVNGKGQTSQAITIDGSDIALTGYTKGSSSAAVAATDTVNAAISKLENQIDGVTSDSPFEYAAAATKSTVLKGENLQAQNEGEVAIGEYNSSTTGNDAASKTAFSVGNGTGTAARSNAFEVRKNGDIYVNYGNAIQKLQDILSNEIDWYYGD